MGSNKEIFQYLGGLNSDDEDRRLPEGDVRRALNVRSSTSDSDKAGTVTSVLGHKDKFVNKLPFLDGGDNKCIGYAEDVEGNRVFLFYYNSEGNHSIISHVKGSNGFSLIAKGEYLNFKEDVLINHANVVEDFLLWTADDGNPPRKINHVKARLFSEFVTPPKDGYQVMDDQTITAIKRPPVKAPIVYYEQDTFLEFEVAFSFTTWSRISDKPKEGFFTYNNSEIIRVSTTGVGQFIDIKLDSSINGAESTNIYIREVGTSDWYFLVGSLNVFGGDSTFKRSETYPSSIDSRAIEEGRFFDLKVNPLDQSVTIQSFDFLNSYNFSVANNVKYSTKPHGDIDEALRGSLSSINLTTESNYQPLESIDVIDKQQFQFATSYVYDDFEPSTVSPYASIPLLVRFSTLNVNIRFETGHETVRSIILYARKGVSGDWFKFKQFDKFDSENNVLIPSNSTQTFLFESKSFLEGVDQTDFVRPFDYIPIQAKCQEFLNSGNLAYGNYLEGYDSVDVDFKTTLKQEKSLLVDTEFLSFDVKKIEPFKFFLTNFQIQNYTTGDLPLVALINPKEGFEYFTRNYSLNGSNSSIVLDISSNIEEAEQAIIDGDYGIIFNAKHSNDTKDWISNYVDYPTFKSGGKYRAGVVYYDEANRSGSVNIDPNGGDIIIPFYTQNKPYDELEGTRKFGFRNFIEWELNSKPPVWATHYQVVYTDCLDVVESHHISITGSTPDASDDELVDADVRFYRDTVTDERIDDYIFQEGDRLRFIAYSKTDSLSSGNVFYFDEYLDVQILGFDPATKKLKLRDYDYPTSAETNGVSAVLFHAEIYRPIETSENVIFKERSEIYDIINPGTDDRLHAGHTADQSTDSPARGVLYRADYFKRNVDVVNSYGTRLNSLIDESRSIRTSSYLEVSNGGRLNIQSDLLKQRRFKTGLRHGGKFIQNTQINNLLRFDFNDATELSEKYGEITKIIEVGYTLKCLQQYNVTSVYIQRTQTLDSQGQTNLALTNKIFGTINPSEDNYGCSHPESVRKNNRHLYFFDANNGLVVRDSPNGMIPISDYKMVSYFRKKGTETFNRSSVTVLGNIDKEFKEYVLTFKGIENEESIAFYEGQNRWKTFYDYIPDMTANVGDQAYALKDQFLFELNKGEDYNRFLNEFKNSEIDVVFNQQSHKVKVFESLAMYSNVALDIPEIIIPKDQLNRNTDRLSRLLKTKFEQKEGVYYAELLKDMNTPNFSTQVLALINGDEMRGQTILFKLVYDGNEEMILESFLLHSNPSELSL